MSRTVSAEIHRPGGRLVEVGVVAIGRTADTSTAKREAAAMHVLNTSRGAVNRSMSQRLARRWCALALGLVPVLGLGLGTSPATSARPASRAPAAKPGPVFVPPAQTATSGCTLRGPDPDPACTPGAVNRAVTPNNLTRTICHPGWSSRQRAKYLPWSGPHGSPALKRKVAAYYVPPGVPATSEGDHLISIELGGDPAGGPHFSGANFFDEPHDLTGPDGQPAGSFVKDGFENHLHRMICVHVMTLAEAQRQIATDWYGFYVAAGRPGG